MTFPVDAVGLAGALAVLLFFLAAQQRRGSQLAAGAGVLILTLAALYSADIVNLPEAFAAVLIGAASGFIIGRDLPALMVNGLLALMAGGIGAAAGAMAIAMWINPFAFGLISDDADQLPSASQLLLCLVFGAGGLACAGAVVTLIRGTRVRLMLGAASLAGWAVSGCAFLLGSFGLVVAGGLAGSAAFVLVARSVTREGRKGLADQAPHP